MPLFLVAFLCCFLGYRGAKFYIDWENARFVKDGETFQYVSGGLHYFRIPPEYWEHRIRTAKSAGLNAIQTYVVWNRHEPMEGRYNFKGNFDIVAFIKEVQKQDMALIMRVGPYICGEKNFGGLPPWLLGIPGMEVRSRNEDYMFAVQRWLKVFLPKLKPYLYNNGGPIIMLQIENEYGAFGCDHEYMRQMYDMFYAALGDDVVYFTTDGPGDYYCGSYNTTKVLSTVDYLEDNDAGEHTDEIFADLRKFQPGGPLVNSEYYSGWLDKWGQKHFVRTAESLGRNLNKLLAMNASVNIFMWHGGSNFGLAAGDYTAITSYDYDAPQSESGDLKLDKYWAVRNATEKHWPGRNTMPVPGQIAKLSGKTIKMKERGLITGLISPDNLLKVSEYPYKMEEIGLFEGMVAYRHVLKEPLVHAEVAVIGVHDRAYILADDRFVKVIKRDSNSTFLLSASKAVTLIVEGMGHIAWLTDGLGSYDIQYKGLENVTVNGEILTDWNHYKIDIRNTVRFAEIGNKTVGQTYWIKSKPLLPVGPAAYGGSIHLKKDEVRDTFLDTSCWSKGYLTVNNILIGRYWPDAGPQYTLYIPATYLKEGTNTITLVELQSACHKLTVKLTDKHVIDGPVDPDSVA